MLQMPSILNHLGILSHFSEDQLAEYYEHMDKYNAAVESAIEHFDNANKSLQKLVDTNA